MSQFNSSIKYFLYARKSSESEDRQIQSIDDQVTRITQLAREKGLLIVRSFSEAKSAKRPNNRPIFEDMIKRIEDGEADGILCWQINRLSRNPIDSGKISWLLQQEILKSIQTIDRQYLPDDNVLLFNVESGMANQYIIDLRKNVKRGIECRLNKGWSPNMAPLGYLNVKESKTIIKDPERFTLVRKMWDLMLTGNYTPPQILNIVNREWGFLTRKTKRMGGKELSLGGIYRIFHNIFYTGILDYHGNHYQGKHEPMITLDEYDRVQFLLGRKGGSRPQIHTFTYTGLLRCAECGCMFTAEKKRKFIKKTNEIKEYIYYHCTRKTKRINCTQRKVIREDNLETQIKQEIERYVIIPIFRNWALEILDHHNSSEIADQNKIAETRQNGIQHTQRELEELTKMRYRQLIDDLTFLKERDVLQSKIERLTKVLKAQREKPNQYTEMTKEIFNSAGNALKAFQSGGLELKRGILLTFGKTLLIRDGILILEPYEWFIPIKNNYPDLETEYRRLEPINVQLNTDQIEAIASIRSRWYTTVNEVRTIIEKYDGNIILPKI